MGKIIKQNTTDEIALVDEERALMEASQGLLMDARTYLDGKTP